ncbi:MAG: hypothetical protein AB7E47_12960 [Desulfovibrionaceae bacterium]
MLLTCLIILCAGVFSGMFFGKPWPMCVAIGIALLLWTVFAVTGGAVAAYKSLEHTRFRHVEDGTQRCLITLHLGPFSYTVEVPEAQKQPNP